MARDVTGSNIGLSFIDVLASALGAAVLLFVILASLPPQVSSRARAVNTFIRYEWRVTKDPKALLRIKLYSSGAPNTPYWIDPDDTSGSKTINCKQGSNSILVAGFSPQSDLGDDAVAKGDRTYILRLNGVSPGRWRVGLVYFDRLGNELSNAPSQIEVSLVRISWDSDGRRLEDGRVIRGQGSNVTPTAPFPDNEKVTLRYADELLSPAIEEGGRRESLCNKS